MGIFDTKKGLASLSYRIGQATERLDALERANRSLELEFTELYDKVRHQMSRMAKRAAVNDKENGGGPEVLPLQEDNLGTDAISASILRRRGIRRQAE